MFWTIWYSTRLISSVFLWNILLFSSLIWNFSSSFLSYYTYFILVLLYLLFSSSCSLCYFLKFLHGPNARLHPSIKVKCGTEGFLLWWFWRFSGSHFLESIILYSMFSFFDTIKLCSLFYVFFAKIGILPGIHDFTVCA